MLNIPEALFILALDDEEGEIHESAASSLESTLAGAVLVELVLQNRIELADHRVIVTDQTQTECSILNQALFDILDTSRPRKLGSVVSCAVRPIWRPAARIVWPSGVEICPSLLTFAPNKNTRPPT